MSSRRQHNHQDTDPIEHQDDTHHGGRNRPANPVRRANAIAVVVALVFFLVHALLGMFALASGWRGSLEFLVWVGVVVIALHIVLSMATTYNMFTDKVHPASDGKKRHQALKWTTGIILAVLIVGHICIAPMNLDAAPPAGAIALVALLGVGGWHCFIGTKSLIRDLRKSRRLRTPFRIFVIALACALALALAVISIARRFL